MECEKLYGDNTQWDSINEVSKHKEVKEKLYEVWDNGAFGINENLNDGWSNIDFVVECRVNGMLESENLNEVYRDDSVSSTSENLNETFQNMDLVSVSWFNEVHLKSMRRLRESMVD